MSLYELERLFIRSRVYRFSKK
ncbi:hypothetical protein ACQ27_gp276 [Klebsiella phage K64-1]|nr:hypothetical protein ACQ27_gp276 [Klebsiella phage K64-1]